MAKKLAKKEYPQGHNASDFKAFGPPALRDGEFDDVKICDMGCFTQELVDSNKFYHAAVVQSTLNKGWYTYFEWGRTGAGKPTFQFVECAHENEAQKEFAKQLHSKNDKRGMWVTIGNIKTLQAKPKKDCYLVRPQATRSTGLPDAATIKSNEGVATTPKKTTTKIKRTKRTVDSETIKLLHDLNVGTISYTKGSMADAALPTLSAIEEGRQLLTEAQKRILKVGNELDDQLADKDLKLITSTLYGRIPKKKKLHAPASDWMLTKDNVVLWQQDLDAFEGALGAVDDLEEETTDPFGGLPLEMRWTGPKDPEGAFIHKWMPKASNNRHRGVKNLTIKNVWKVARHGDAKKLHGAQEKIIKAKKSIKERPLFQTRDVPSLDKENVERNHRSNTAFLFHGSRSCNIRGILDKGLMLPKQLSGVQLTGAFLGGGIYYADDFRKSVGYCSTPGSYWASGSGGIQNRSAFMFIAQVALGVPYVSPGSYNKNIPPNGYDCVCGLTGHTGWLANNEWVVYDLGQYKLDYLIEFVA